MRRALLRRHMADDQRTAADGGVEATVDETRTWPELAIGLYERLTGRGAEITYEFEDMQVDVPSKVGGDAEHAQWRLDGTLRIRTREPGDD
jgi:hypothetical protein